MIRERSNPVQPKTPPDIPELLHRARAALAQPMSTDDRLGHIEKQLASLTTSVERLKRRADRAEHNFDQTGIGHYVENCGYPTACVRWSVILLTWKRGCANDTPLFTTHYTRTIRL